MYFQLPKYYEQRIHKILDSRVEDFKGNSLVENQEPFELGPRRIYSQNDLSNMQSKLSRLEEMLNRKKVPVQVPMPSKQVINIPANSSLSTGVSKNPKRKKQTLTKKLEKTNKLLTVKLKKKQQIESSISKLKSECKQLVSKFERSEKTHKRHQKLVNSLKKSIN